MSKLENRFLNNLEDIEQLSVKSLRIHRRLNGFKDDYRRDTRALLNKVEEFERFLTVHDFEKLFDSWKKNTGDNPKGRKNE